MTALYCTSGIDNARTCSEYLDQLAGNGSYVCVTAISTYEQLVVGVWDELDGMYGMLPLDS